MTTAEALEINVLLRWLLNLPTTPGGDLVTADIACASAAYLASRANNHLHTGLTAPDVLNNWHPTAADRDVEWCAWYGGPDPDNAAGCRRHLGDDGQAAAEEDAEWLVDSGVACRTVTYGPWQLHPLDDDHATPAGDAR